MVLKLILMLHLIHFTDYISVNRVIFQPTSSTIIQIKIFIDKYFKIKIFHICTFIAYNN